MSFNQFMHPRNIYRRKPNYEALGKVYPDFGAHLSLDQHKKLSINYADPAALRALTTTLLKHDFGLSVNIPDGRLVPTLPMRLNYLLWVEDLVKCYKVNETALTGLDIGTGCCAIFPLLGVTMNKHWTFVATEIDETNLVCAEKNVHANGYSDRIKVFPGSQDSMFVQLLNSLQGTKVHFTMTNPPFFSDEFNDSFEGNGTAKSQQPPSSAFHHKKVCSSSATEAVVEGGEVAFVKRIIEESLQAKELVDIYTVMLGRRQSFLEIKYLLKDYQQQGVISSFTQTELCQGNTKRWAIAWTFVPSIPLASAPRIKCAKSKPILHYIRPGIECCEYEMKAIARYIRDLLLNDLQIHTFSMIESKKSVEFDIKSQLNTWSNQRKKRRQAAKLAEQSPPAEPGLAQHFKRAVVVDHQQQQGEEPNNNNNEPSGETKRLKPNSDICKSDLTFLLHCGLKVKRDKQQVYLKMVTKEMSQNKESTCQLMQYFKNKLV